MQETYYKIVQNLVLNKPNSYFRILKHRYQHICKYLHQQYPQLTGHPISEYCYWFLHGLTDFPKCQHPTCKNKTKFLSATRGYTQYCSLLCMQSDPLTEAKRIETNLKRFGTEHAQQSEQIKNKCKVLRAERIEKDPNYSKDIGNRIRTGLKNSADKNPDFWNERQEKTRDTNIKNGRDPNWNNREKAKQTIQQSIENNPYYYNEIALKAQKTRDKNKENDPQYQEKITSKMRETKVKNGHNETWINVEKIQETKKLRYNDPYFRNSKKARQTCLKKYGVEHYSQTAEFHKRRSKKYKNKKYEIGFDSEWEFQVYDFCIENNIHVEYQPDIEFEFTFDGKIHQYHPDFLINGKLYEVKGDHFFNADGKMICPYRNKKWTNEYYSYVCDQYESKHQCMKDHHVIILKSKELANLQEFIK